MMTNHPVAKAIESIIGIQVVFGHYLPDNQLPDLSDDQLNQLLAVWRDAHPGLKGLKKAMAHVNMGLPLLFEVERRWNLLATKGKV